MKKLLFSGFFCSILNFCFTQNSFSFQPGLYSGGLFNDIEYSNYWVFKKDFSFLYFGFVGNNLKRYYTGKYAVEKSSTLNLIFSDESKYQIQKKSSYTIQKLVTNTTSNDSIVFSGKLLDNNNISLRYAFVMINERYALSTDSMGNYHLSLPKQKDYRIIFLNRNDSLDPLYFMVTELDNKTNFYRINAKLENIRGESIEKVSYSGVNDFFERRPYKLSVSSKGDELRPRFISFDNTILVEKLKQCLKIQNSEKENIMLLINYLNSDQ